MTGKVVSHYSASPNPAFGRNPRKRDKITEHLSGVMGVVYRAQGSHFKPTVALNYLPHTLTTDLEARQRFIVDALAASPLQHNDISVAYAIDQAKDGSLFIRLHCLEGKVFRIEKLPTSDNSRRSSCHAFNGLSG